MFEEILPSGEKLSEVINQTNVINLDHTVNFLFVTVYGKLVMTMNFNFF